MLGSTIWAPKGETGDKGPTGDPGPQGQQGPTGNAGPDAAVFAQFLLDINNATDVTKGVSLVGRAARVADNLAALRSTITVGVTVPVNVVTLGWATRGDGAQGVYYLDKTDTTSADNNGTVVVTTDGGRMKLAHNGQVSVRQFGAGIAADSTAAIQSALNAVNSAGYPELYFPAATYVISSNLTCSNKPLRLRGAGMGKAILRFTGTAQGLSIIQTTAAQVIDIQDFTFITTSNPVSNNYGLKVDGSSQIAGTGGGHSILGNRTDYRGMFRNLEFKGSDFFSNGWAVGLNIKAVMNFDISNISYTGWFQGDGNYLGVGVLINGDGVPTDFSIDRIWTFYTSYSILLPDYVEGGHITNFEFVHAMRGIYGQYDSTWSSIPEGSTGCLSMFIDRGHINCRLFGVKLANTNQNSIGALNIYLNALASDGAAYGVSLTNGTGSTITGVKVNGDNCANVKASNHGVLLSSTGSSTVSDSQFIGGGAAVRLQTNCTLNHIQSNIALNCVNAVSSDNTDANNLFFKNTGTGLSGAKYAVGVNNNVAQETWSTTTVRTLVGGGVSENINIPVPLNRFTAKPSSAILQVAGGSSETNITGMYDFDNAASTATNLIFNLRVASGANLPSGGHRFSIIAFE